MGEGEKRPLEYRVNWSASSNISFQGASDWEEWGGEPEDTHEDIVDDLARGRGGVCDGLEIALEASGFDWWVETR